MGEHAKNEDSRPTTPQRWTRYAFLLLKILISSTLLYVLASRFGGNALLNTIRLLNPLSFIAAVVLYLLASFFSTLRWKLLIPCTIGTKRLFGMYMIGSFFNTYLPSGIGGDAVKAYYLSREMKGRQRTGDDKKCPHMESPLTIAIASVFMDRYLGFGALLMISTAALPFGISYLRKASSTLPVLWFIPSLVVFFVVASIVIFRFRLGRRLNPLANTYRYFQMYAAKRKTIIKALYYSIALQMLGVAAIYVLARGLSLDISFLSLIVFVPIIIVFSMIPVSISGIGLREGAFVFLLGAINIPPEKSLALSLIWFFSVFTAGLWGLFEYLRFKTVFGRKKE